MQNFDRSKKKLNWTQIFAIWDTEQNWPSTVQHFAGGECNWLQALGLWPQNGSPPIRRFTEGLRLGTLHRGPSSGFNKIIRSSEVRLTPKYPGCSLEGEEEKENSARPTVVVHRCSSVRTWEKIPTLTRLGNKVFPRPKAKCCVFGIALILYSYEYSAGAVFLLGSFALPLVPYSILPIRWLIPYSVCRFRTFSARLMG